MIYSINIHNVKWEHTNISYLCHHKMAVYLIDAENEYQAKGEALTKNQNDYPPSQGWTLSEVISLEVTNCINGTKFLNEDANNLLQEEDNLFQEKMPFMLPVDSEF